MTVILSALRGQRGLIAVALDEEAQEVSLRYDPALIDAARMEAVADQVSAQLAAHRAVCPAEGGARCAECMARLNEMLQVVDPAGADTHRVVYWLAPDSPFAAEVVRSLTPPSEAAPKSVDPEEEEAVRPLLIATVLCAVFLVAGLAAGWLGVGPQIVLPLYGLSYVAGGYFPVRDGIRTLVQGHRLDINFLMILGSLGAAVLGKWEEGATLMFLFALSSTLESFAVGRTRSAIRKLMALAPEEALVRRSGVERRIPVEQLMVGDLVIVGPGERIAADGEVVRGTSAVNEAAITGESIPVDKGEGDKVFAGTVNGQGSLEFRVTKPASETTLARIAKAVEEAQAEKAASQRMTDWVDRYYTLIVMAVALLAWVLPPLLGGQTWSDAFYRAMMLLVVASPCALVISTPAAILSSIARAARAGILFKGGVHLEQAAGIKVVALDKTGTLTTGRPSVVKVLPEEGVSEAELFRLAAAVESRSEHPLADAVIRAAREREIDFPTAEGFQALTGLGARATVDGCEVLVGAPKLLAQKGINPPAGLSERLEQLYEDGLTTIVVVADSRVIGCLGLADTPRPEARDAVAHLKKLGVEKVVMLTGDNRRAAQQVARAVGVDEVCAELLPEDKLKRVKELTQQYGNVAMVGDGVNDAPALATATVGIAMGGVGSDVAMETADLVLMADELEKAAQAVNLARQTRKVVTQNLSFAIGVIVTLVTLVLLNKLTLPVAVVGHEGSTILVAFNGLRLLAARLEVA